ncbi:MAG TPA: cupin domain-containing protein [Blastocatellia bacterium]|nr:cupin domain-containing protein [Blastocatellia bacterium]
MKRPAALVIRLDAVKKDAALDPEGRGARKLLVTELYSETEQEATEVLWSPPEGAQRCPVQVTADTELAVFTEQAAQDRHYHREATEIYMVVEGEMTIEVEGRQYALRAGDMIVVNPGAAHEVKRGKEKFLCRVITVNCKGMADKFPAS